MKLIISTIIALLTTVSAISQNQSPQLISSSANSQINSGVQLSWSLGEIITETYSSANIMLSQGFLQPKYNINTSTLEPMINGMAVYPNPAADHLIIQFDKTLPENLTYQFIQMDGQICFTGQIEFNKTKIIIDPRLPKGIYILRILSSNLSENKSFRISINR